VSIDYLSIKKAFVRSTKPLLKMELGAAQQFVVIEPTLSPAVE
jgi:hypothetical protein